MEERTFKAFAAAQRIMDKLEEAGLNIYEPNDIFNADFNLILSDLNKAWGASRIVIWDDECDYVIKIAREKYFEKYNEHEVEVYNAAINEGLEESFAWCKCYIEPSEWEDEYIPGVYVMEFLEGEEDDISSQAYQNGLSNYCKARGIEHITSDICQTYESSVDEDEEIIELIELSIPVEKWGIFERFLIDWNVSDLHCGNVLYRGKQIVICDYAGWSW